MGISVTPIPRLTVLADPSFTLGTTNAAGDALTAVASNSTLLAFDTTLPAATGTSATGSATVTARRDHVHASTIAATKAQLEAGTITTAWTSPANQQAHDSAAKAWAVVGKTGTLHSPSYNTNSITYVSAGKYYHVFDTDFDDVHYAYACTSKEENGAVICEGYDVAQQEVRVQSSSHVQANSAWSAVAFGQQATT